jgi:predicted nucleotidyltransferase
MSNTSLDISGKIDSRTCSAYRAVSDAAAGLRIPFVVVGASARDLVMHHGCQVPLERATQDLDFGIQVPNWDAFYALKEALRKQGFSPAKVDHRLYSEQGTPIDIVPFGGNQDVNAQISWPPQGDVVMSVLGFREACDNALQVRIQEEPELVFPSPPPKA